MNISPQVDKIFPAFVAFHAELEGVAKGKAVNAGKVRYKYAELSSLQDYVRPLLAKHGLAVLQPGDRDCVVTMLIHDSGQYIAGSTKVIMASEGAKEQGSAITYARRYGLASLLDLVQEDDDGQTADGYAGIRRPKASPAQAGSTGASNQIGTSRAGTSGASHKSQTTASAPASKEKADGAEAQLLQKLQELDPEDRDGHMELVNQARTAGMKGAEYNRFKKTVTDHFKG